jgi:hypothetical protein
MSTDLIAALSKTTALMEMLSKMSSEIPESNLFNLPKQFSSEQIQNANKFHASLQKAGLEGYYHGFLKCIIIKSNKSSLELQEIISDGTEYTNWKPEVQRLRDYEGNALVFLS